MDVMEQQPSAATRLTTRLLEKAALQETAIRLDPFCGMHPRPNPLDPRSPKRRLRGTSIRKIVTRENKKQ